MNAQRIATVFGGTGFLGHAVVQALAERGYQVRVPTRDIEKAADLKLMGAVGQIVAVRASVRTEAALVETMQGSDVVINLIGELFETRGNSFQHIHVETAARLGRAAKTARVGHLVHVSALGAGMTARARYARTKSIGEEAVRAFFPNVVILRPSLMFGPRDAFFNKFALLARYMPFLPLIGGGHTKFQPVYVGDVAAAVMAVLDWPEAQGHIFELGGPKIYTFRELMELMLAQLGLRRRLVAVPWGLARFKAWFFELMPTPLLTRDQIELLKTDNIVASPASGSATSLNRVGTMEDLGLPLTKLEDILPHYVG